MVKKGEYIDYAISLEEKSVDYNPIVSLKVDEMVFSTEMSIIIETAKRVKELEERIKTLEEVKR